MHVIKLRQSVGEFLKYEYIYIGLSVSFKNGKYLHTHSMTMSLVASLKINNINLLPD